MAVAFPVNLGALGNSLAIWLGISPWQLFFYVFLPPLLLDAAVRIDWFMFRKVSHIAHARTVDWRRVIQQEKYRCRQTAVVIW
jgi:hypothetical protein